MRFLLLIAASLFLPVSIEGCHQSNPLQGYLDNIPQREEINASLYHYEIIVEEARREFSNQNPYGVFLLYERYLSIFFEASVPHEEELLYWVGKSVQAVVGEGLIPDDGGEGEEFFHYLKADKQRKNTLGIEFQGDYVSNRNGETLPQKLLYQGKHFSVIINQKGDYEWEKKALREIYLQKFIPPGEEGNSQNLEYGYWLVTRYPDLFPYEEYYALLSRFIDPGKLGRNGLNKWNRIIHVLTISHWKDQNKKEDLPLICFPVSGPVVVYNRTHWISSRNLTSLALWEPFRVVAQGQGEDGRIWYAAVFFDHRYGFVDEETFLETCGQEWGPSPDSVPQLEKYQAAYQLFLKKDYLAAVEIVSHLLYEMEGIPDPDLFMMIRGWTFFYKILKEISIRSTSLQNPFTQFVVEHSDYFKVSKDRVNLEVSDYFLKKIIASDQNSPMLQYFDGFN